MTSMTNLYPVVEPFASGMLEVSDGHRLYWEEIGNPEGTPAVYLRRSPRRLARDSRNRPGARRRWS